MKDILRTVWIFMIVFGLAVSSGCVGERNEASNASSTEEIQIVDSAGRTVMIPHEVTRVAVSNRYNMEVIRSLDAMDRICGVDYGIYQDRDAYEAFSLDQVIGNTQGDLNYEKIIELNPQVLILPGNAAWEDAEKKLSPFGIKVVVMNPYYTDHFQELYRLAGKIFGKEDKAEEFISYFQEKLDYVQKQLADVPKKKVYYEYRRAGTTTVPGDYFYKMVEYAGCDNIFKDAINTNIDLETVIARNPEAIVKVGEEDAPPRWQAPGEAELAARKERICMRPGWDQITAVKEDRILMMSQYLQGGAAKIIGTLYIAKFLYPEYLPDLQPEEVFRHWVEYYQHRPYQTGHTLPAFHAEGEAK